MALTVGASNTLGDPNNALQSLNSDKVHDCNYLEVIFRHEWPLKPIENRTT